MKKILSAVLVSFLFALPFAAVAKEESTEYVITKGDTMWGLSERFFKDPYYWPNLWAKNPSITNPHFIYPGQKLKFYPDRVEVVSEQPSEEVSAPGELSTAVAPEKIVPERIFRIGAGETFIADNIRKSGKIVANFENRVMVGEGDYVYTDIGSDRGGKLGEVYSVFQDAGPVAHPVKDYIVGNRIIQLGTIQLMEMTPTSSKAQVLRSFLEISKDSFLTPYQPARREIPLKKATKETNGYIVGTRKTNKLIGEGEIVYLDLGSKQDIEVGNLLYAVREVKPDTNAYFSADIKLPLQVLGAVVVVNVGDETSTALVVKSVAPMYPGTKIVLKPGK